MCYEFGKFIPVNCTIAIQIDIGKEIVKHVPFGQHVFAQQFVHSFQHFIAVQFPIFVFVPLVKYSRRFTSFVSCACYFHFQSQLLHGSKINLFKIQCLFQCLFDFFFVDRFHSRPFFVIRFLSFVHIAVRTKTFLSTFVFVTLKRTMKSLKHLFWTIVLQ